MSTTESRLSSTITVEDGPLGYLTLIREHPRSPACITLTADAEARLLALLLARQGLTSPTPEED